MSTLEAWTFGERGCSHSYCFWTKFPCYSQNCSLGLPLHYQSKRWHLTSRNTLQVKYYIDFQPALVSLRRVFLCIVTLCNSSWFYTQTCLCLLHLLPDLGIGWSLAGVFELELVSRILVTAEICAVWLLVFLISPNLKYRLQMCCFSFLKDG